jgi:hypothetical protein
MNSHHMYLVLWCSAIYVEHSYMILDPKSSKCQIYPNSGSLDYVTNHVGLAGTNQ